MSFKKIALPYARGSAHFKPEFSIEQHGRAGPLDFPVLFGLAVGHADACCVAGWSPGNLLLCLRSRSQVHLSRSAPGGDRKEGGRGPLLSLSLSAAPDSRTCRRKVQKASKGRVARLMRRSQPKRLSAFNSPAKFFVSSLPYFWRDHFIMVSWEELSQRAST